MSPNCIAFREQGNSSPWAARDGAISNRSFLVLNLISDSDSRYFLPFHFPVSNPHLPEGFLERILGHAEPLLLAQHLQELVELDRVVDLVLGDVANHLQQFLF